MEKYGFLQEELLVAFKFYINKVLIFFVNKEALREELMGPITKLR